jgi:hypothetical protein
MLRFLAVFWAYAVSWVCAAFVHLADGGLNGIQSLFAPTVFVSVSLIALIVLIPVVFCCVAYFRGVWRAFFGSVCVFAIGLGAILMLLGFGGNSVGSWFVGFAGSAAIFGLVLVAASLPLVLFRGIGNEVPEAHP